MLVVWMIFIFMTFKLGYGESFFCPIAWLPIVPQECVMVIDTHPLLS